MKAIALMLLAILSPMCAYALFAIRKHRSRRAREEYSIQEMKRRQAIRQKKENKSLPTGNGRNGHDN